MANEEVLGPRKTMFVLVIVVGCFAVLWPRILSPLVLGTMRDQLQPNQFDRDAGCCEVMFGTELTVLELINEVCSSAVQVNGKLSPIAAAECRKAVNDTCGVDIAAFVKRTDNIGKSSKLLVQTMQASNSSCLKEHFGVPLVSLSPHQALNYWTLQDTIKQERPPIRGAGPHPALRERGRAIPPGAPAASPQVHIQMPPNVRPPPIPGMRPPLGSPGGPVPAPKTSMGFVMPIYTVCIIVFFVYTISKLFFKRATVPYETVVPDPQFRRRVFRDDSRTTPDKLVVTAISGLVAEVQQQMEAGYAQNQQRQDAQDNHARPYTNGTIIHNRGPVHIIASEYNEAKDKFPQPTTEPKTKSALEQLSEVPEHEEKQTVEDSVDKVAEDNKEHSEVVPETKDEDTTNVTKDIEAEKCQMENEEIEKQKVPAVPANESKDTDAKQLGSEEKAQEVTPKNFEHDQLQTNDLVDLTEAIELKKNGDIGKTVEDFLREEARAVEEIESDTAKELQEAADYEDSKDNEQEKSSVKVMCMETRAHSADGGPPPRPAAPAPAPRAPAASEEVKSIYLETEIPTQTRVLVADFAEDTPSAPANKHSPMVVSGKMTLSLIQDAPRDTPERDLESTVDEFTTASAITQPAEKEGSESEGEIEEEIEVEEIEGEVEEEEEEEEQVETIPEHKPKQEGKKLEVEEKKTKEGKTEKDEKKLGQEEK